MVVKKIVKGKKKWVKIIAPEIFNKVEVGDSYVVTANQLVGRMFVANLSELVNDLKKQHIGIKLKVERAEGERAITSSYAYTISPSYIKRFIRRGKNKIDDSFVCTTADGKRVRVKFSTITRGHANQSVCTSIRKKTREILAKKILEKSFEQGLREICEYRPQTQLKNDVKRIYPVKVCEITYFGIEAGPEGHRQKAKVAKEEVSTEEAAAEEGPEEVIETKEDKNSKQKE